MFQSFNHIPRKEKVSSHWMVVGEPLPSVIGRPHPVIQDPEMV